ncbi:DDHD domain-containing protein [Thamnocephalis sphaerospora]|uniref:DDHD domain-containing protein n=1 Tax=Thamnocephalis sphaerospora TaxID=78915 RepID=A0A4P9XVY9_9FUNG|nr:DDHD domain-containing protein [Thamnocephalis sphaerospora]|eukprot:RKP10456.1 DDHD domain-containing protein [Thamnocephalis sphaerospora]
MTAIATGDSNTKASAKDSAKEEEEEDEDLFGGGTVGVTDEQSNGAAAAERRAQRLSRAARLGTLGPQAFLPSLPGITLDGVPAIRMLVSDVLLDVLLYMTPKYRRQMYDALADELNRIYQLFLKRNPRFLADGGRVSILGHSLGSVLSFDLLCAQESRADAWMQLRDRAAGLQRARSKKGGAMRKQRHRPPPKLEFSVANLFCLGSPIGLFMLLKGCALRPRAPDGRTHYEQYTYSAPGTTGVPVSLGADGLPHARLVQPLVSNLYNIFHRADPVAYRMEPLVDPKGVPSTPKTVPYTKGGLRGLHLGMQEVSMGIAGKASTMFATMRTSIRAVSIFKTLGSAAGAESPKPHADSGGSDSSEVPDVDDAPAALSDDPRVLLSQLNRNGRVDWCLQGGVLESEYLTGLQVHFNYWSDSDVAAFLMRECAHEHALGDLLRKRE